MDKKILVADVPDLDACLAQLLAGNRVVFVRTLDEALRALAGERFDLVIISVHFDDSRMFDLLRQVRAEERNREVPVICLREAGLGFTAISGRTLEVTCRALEANAFVDLAKFAGEGERDGALRQVIDGLLARAPG